MAINQLKAGAALNYAVLVLNTIVSLVYTPYMLRMIGQSEYGLYSLVSSVIAYLTVLDLGLGNAVVRYTAKYRAEGKYEEQYRMFGMFLILYIGIGCLALIGGGALYFNVYSMFGDTMSSVELEHARIMMIILVFNLAVTFPMSIFGSIMNASERFVFPRIVNIVRIILNTIVMVVLLNMGYKAIAMVVVQTLFNFLTLILNYVYCKRRLKIKILFGKFHYGFLSEVAIYSFWIFLNVIMDKIYWSTGQFVLGAVSGTVAVSIYAIAIYLEGVYLQFSTAISNVFLPKVTGMVAQEDNRQQISDLFIRTGRIQNIIMSLMLFGFIVFGEQFVSMWAGDDYMDAYLMAVTFFIALYIPSIQNLGITILQARNQMQFRSILFVIIAVFALFAEILLARLWGGLGCALAIAGALFLGQGVVLNFYYHKIQSLDMIKFWKEILYMDIVPIIVSFIFLIFTRKYHLIYSWASLALWVFIYSIVYSLLFYRFSMNQYERDLLIQPILSRLRK